LSRSAQAEAQAAWLSATMRRNSAISGLRRLDE
jgi:hypothetical protein